MQSYLSQLVPQLESQLPFSLLKQESRTEWFKQSKLVQLEPGQTLTSPRHLQERIYLVVEGKIRLLADIDGEIETLDLRGPGQLVGWVSLLRGSSCEWVTASETSVCLALPSDLFIKYFSSEKNFASWFHQLSQPQESYLVANYALNFYTKRFPDWNQKVKSILPTAVVCSIRSGEKFEPPAQFSDEYEWYLSTSGVPDCPVGSRILSGSNVPEFSSYCLPIRILGLSNLSKEVVDILPYSVSAHDDAQQLETLSSVSLEQLGILEHESIDELSKFPIIKGHGILYASMAACEMIALVNKVPFRRDAIKKVLEEQFRRDKILSLELLASLTEGLGLRTQIGNVNNEYLGSIEAPALLLLDDIPVVIFDVKPDSVILGDPVKGMTKISLKKLQEKLGPDVKFALPRRIGSTPTSRFGWSWFTPLLAKYKKSLILVFIASLLAQLFGLGIPLLIQQIIDKVLTQGNMSSLNVLGTLMIVLAIFQGCLTVLRTYIFVDTTDRMDLALGSAVIDRLLSLPLKFFEKRPVGELSQRIGELNTIRGFLTGTALVSVLSLIFAALYLVVMILYSPLLTLVSLSTFPIYVMLVFGIAPLYRYLIRQRASAQAKTQSHLIEVLSGIQTVKAQHFELTARWKWQDRYRNFVNEGFKSVVLGSTSGQIGDFLNQLSGLLVLWVGMWLVLQGELTLGMLIAFRIISGNVTGPLLQLSSLYQGYQMVQVSMERLSDILDQNPELSRSSDINQIAMPPILGNIRFEDVSFRFGMKGPFQVNNVSLNIEAGSFVGIVGQSGSGKSTLMKLLPRLYELEHGRIFIDDYDIGKVELSSLRRQIGIVPQDSLLFEGSISENIALNDPQATDEAIIEAAKLACAHDFIMSLSDGYATQLAERGSNISGGQRQRIAIARTILSNPQLLVMDEATSALDYNTETQLCRNLQSWAEDRTVLFITHRLSSIKSSDLILVMNDGNLVEQGTHDQLIDLGQRYAALYKQQGQ